MLRGCQNDMRSLRRSMSIETEIGAILDSHDHPDESESQLWHDLARWVFAEDDDGERVREIPASYEMTDEVAETLLDEVASQVPGLETASDWASAARYFEAENNHGLKGPDARRAIALRKRR